RTRSLYPPCRVAYFFSPSHRELSILQYSPRPAPAVALHRVTAWASANCKVPPIAQPTPGVPAFGSIATAMHSLVKVPTTLQSLRPWSLLPLPGLRQERPGAQALQGGWNL